jgi:Protein of unknown function (DUF2914)/Tetratricopeptide repeat
MSDPVSLASLFDAAEQAALGGDFAAASRLLGEAARAQEAALGPHHLELANTLNNLAVVHERCGQLDDAEREYRRAHAIAARTLPADDPLVTTSAQNLREFCEANGRPVDEPPPAMSLADATDIGDAPTIVAMPAPAQADVPTVPIEPLAMTFADAAPPAPAAPRSEAPAPAPLPSVAKPAPVAAAPAPARTSAPAPVSSPSPAPAPAPARASAPPPAATPAAATRGLSIPVLVALGAVAVLVIWLLAGRGPAAPPAEPQAAAPDPPPASATPAPVAVPRPAPAPPTARPSPAARPAAPAADGSLTVGDAQLCTSLSASYRCDAAGSTVRSGRLTFYTRLIATRDTSVVHRWYRGDQLRQAVRLDVPARRGGFRTFSRGTVWASDGEWRVELRTRDGQLLHTERFTVR